MLKKNKAVIIENPQHFTAVTIWFPDLQSTVDNEAMARTIDGLEKEFDLYFVFSENLLGHIDFDKYSKLFMAKGYVVSQDADQCQAMVWTLDYLRTFFKLYTGFYVLESNLLENQEKRISEMVRVVGTPLNIGIMEYKRASYEDIWEYSRIPDSRDYFLPARLVSLLEIDSRGMYCTHKFTGDIIFLRPFIIDRMNEFLGDKAEYTKTPGPLFLDSFSGFRFGDFLASWCIKTKMVDKFLLNVKLEDAKA